MTGFILGRCRSTLEADLREHAEVELALLRVVLVGFPERLLRRSELLQRGRETAAPQVVGVELKHERDERLHVVRLSSGADVVQEERKEVREVLLRPAGQRAYFEDGEVHPGVRGLLEQAEGV